jgi:hypothetical protein
MMRRALDMTRVQPVTLTGRGRVGWFAAAACASGLAAAGAALAEPLPKVECDKLKTEQAQLAAGGVKEWIAKGPAWGRDNLGRDKLAQVERYIVLEEQLGFRCGLARARLSLPFAEEDRPPADPEEARDAKGETPAAATPASPKAKPKPKPKAAPAAAPAEAAAAPAAKATPKVPEPAPRTPSSAAAKPAPKQKAKVDDAYRPPTPSDPGADPFAKK